MKVVLIPGDGIGKEIAQSVVDVSSALQTNIEWEQYEAGATYYQTHQTLMQEGLLDAIENNKLALKGPTATPIGKGFRSINVLLRQHFNTYANVRPVHTYTGVPSRYTDVDLVVIRENTEDLYKGVEYTYDANTAHSLKIITRSASKRIIEYAFEYALQHHRKQVTCVHKANIMKLSDGLFLDVFHEVSKNYPTIQANDVIIDALCMKLVTNPTQFDVLVAPNLYGDIISDLCAGLVGGLGFAPSANIGENVRIYEAVHGSAPDIAGKDICNPTALLLSFAMLLKDHGQQEKALLLENTIASLLEEGKYTTQDIGGNTGCKAFTKALIERLTCK